MERVKKFLKKVLTSEAAAKAFPSILGPIAVAAPRPLESYISPPEEKEFMRYHGITGMKNDPQKMESYFTQNGKSAKRKFSAEFYGQMLRDYRGE